MKRLIKLILAVFMLMVMLPGMTVHAETSVTAEIPIEADNGAVIQITNEADAPMPASDKITVQNGKGTFQITYTEPGDYKYQVVRTDRSGFSTYSVLVSVTNNDDGTGYKVVVCITRESDNKKVPSASFISEKTGGGGTPAATPSAENTVGAAVPAGFIANTGDTFHAWIYILILGIAAVIAVAAIRALKKKDE